MLSVENLREHCRTCLMKLERINESDYSKFIPIKKFPALEFLIQVCLAKDTVGKDILCLYAPFLCSSCFEKWLDFSKLYEVAMETSEKIRNVVEKVSLQIKNLDYYVERNKNINEFFINCEALQDYNEIEQFEIPFYPNSNKLMNTMQGTGHSQLKYTKNSTHLVTKQREDNSNSCSDHAEESDFIYEHSNDVFEITNLEKNKSTRKSLLVRKKTYKGRKCLTKMSETHIVDLGNIVSKRIRYQCEQCNKYFWEKVKYEGHMKQVHEGIKRAYKCQQCDKAYNLYKTLLQHKREYHSEKLPEVFKCDKCDKIFKTGVILKQHLNNKHSEQKEAMRSICEQCGFIAAHQYSLSRHIINKHTEPDQIKCSQCPKVFKTQYSLKYHVIGNHNPSNIKPFKCPDCQVGFSRKTLLNQHKRTHTKYTERIKCDFEGCEVRFVKHGDKTHHMRLVHLKVKQHICDFCGEAFGAMQTLRHHRFIHTGEKPYKCNICGHGFRQRTAMKTHRKTHFGMDTGRQDATNNLQEMNLSLRNNLSS